MKTHIYALYDKKLNSYYECRVDTTEKEAYVYQLGHYLSVVGDKLHLEKYLDSDLYFLGDIDVNTGEVIGPEEGKPEFICALSSLYKKNG